MVGVVCGVGSASSFRKEAHRHPHDVGKPCHGRPTSNDHLYILTHLMHFTKALTGALTVVTAEALFTETSSAYVKLPAISVPYTHQSTGLTFWTGRGCLEQAITLISRTYTQHWSIALFPLRSWDPYVRWGEEHTLAYQSRDNRNKRCGKGAFLAFYRFIGVEHIFVKLTCGSSVVSQHGV